MRGFLFIILCLIIWFLPLPFGGNVEWAVLGFEVSVWLLFIIHLVSRLKDNQEETEPRLLNGLIIFCLALFFLVGLVQIVPWPESLVTLLSPRSKAWRQSLVETGLLSPAEIRFQALSLSPWASAYEYVRFLTYGVFAYLLSRVLTTVKRIQALTLVLIGAGVFQSLYGLSEFFGGTNRIFTWVNRYYSGSAFGTFVNRDHYSAFLEMLFPLSLGYFLVRSKYFTLKPGLSWQEKLVRLGQEQVQKSLLFLLPPFIIGIGLFFSRCRSGIIIFVITFFLTLLLVSLTTVAGHQKVERRLIKTVVILVVLAVVLIGLEPILERFTEGGFFDETRMLYYTYTTGLIFDYPLTGSGLGTYAQAINPYLKKNFNVIISHAHNDYLEMLAEAGWLGGGALILAGFLALALALKRWFRCQHALGKGIGLGAIMGVFSLFFHSLTDFSLRMPGNAAVWLSLFVLALKAPLVVDGRRKNQTEESEL